MFLDYVDDGFEFGGVRIVVSRMSGAEGSSSAFDWAKAVGVAGKNGDDIDRDDIDRDDIVDDLAPLPDSHLGAPVLLGRADVLELEPGEVVQATIDDVEIEAELIGRDDNAAYRRWSVRLTFDGCAFALEVSHMVLDEVESICAAKGYHPPGSCMCVAAVVSEFSPLVCDMDAAESRPGVRELHSEVSMRGDFANPDRIFRDDIPMVSMPDPEGHVRIMETREIAEYLFPNGWTV